MGKFSDWSGKYFVCDDVNQLGDDEFNLDNMGKDTVGDPYDYNG